MFCRKTFPHRSPISFSTKDSRRVPGRWSAPGILIFKSSTISLPTLKLLGVVSISINLKRYIGLLFQNYIIDINLLDQGLQMGPNTVLSYRFPSQCILRFAETILKKLKANCSNLAHDKNATKISHLGNIPKKYHFGQEFEVEVQAKFET